MIGSVMPYALLPSVVRVVVLHHHCCPVAFHRELAAVRVREGRGWWTAVGMATADED
jgi:hypothetical protein